MKKYAYIMVGGALGAVLRLAIENTHIWNYHENIPLNTLIINITGSFILALFLTIAFEVLEVDADLRLGVSTGFLGAFTTFSTLCMETVMLLSGGEYFSAISYVTMSTMLGLAAAYFGIVLARESVSKLLGDTSKGVKEIIDEGEA
ncbi:MAG: fluoride efflux transporter CrcB [Clostridiaceae bacterium]